MTTKLERDMKTITVKEAWNDKEYKITGTMDGTDILWIKSMPKDVLLLGDQIDSVHLDQNGVIVKLSDGTRIGALFK